MEAARNVNLALRFLLELTMLWAFVAWGFATGPNPVAKLGLGLGTPVLAAIVWGAFLSPKAAVTLPKPMRVVLELLLFGAAAAAFAAAGQPVVAIAFAALVLLNEALITVFDQRTPAGQRL